MKQDEDISPPASLADRRRRLADAVRLLPVLGLFLFLLPVLATGGSNGLGTAGGLVFVFSIWGILIVISALLSLQLDSDDGADEGNRRG